MTLPGKEQSPTLQRIHSLAKGWSLFVVGLVLVTMGGCVERVLILRSSPPGAEVFLDGRPAGTTPAEISFVHYGEREVVLRHPGHKPLRGRIELEPPLYQVFPLDFVSEILIPYTFRDEQIFQFNLEKASPKNRADLQKLWKRAEKERNIEK